MFETIYFNMFNVNVLTYIDFNEVLMLLYSDVVLYIVIVLVGLVYYVIVGWFFDWLFAIFNWLFKRLLKDTRIMHNRYITSFSAGIGYFIITINLGRTPFTVLFYFAMSTNLMMALGFTNKDDDLFLKLFRP